jgi:SCF-associated factor 1
MPWILRVAFTYGVRPWSSHNSLVLERVELGTLNGESFVMGDGFDASGKTARTPLRLNMPATMRSIR